MILQSVTAGSAALVLIHGAGFLSSDIAGYAETIFGVGVVLNGMVIALGEFGMPHASETAARAAHEITHGKYARVFWIGGITIGHVIPIALLFAGPLGLVVGAPFYVIGLYANEHVFVAAPQEIPNS